MSGPNEVGVGTVSDNQVYLPAHIRCRFDIDDGDVIRWKVVEDELVADVQHRGGEAFADFEPGASEDPVDGIAEHDGFGVE
ncbi:AbrB/MazE/SpoVT family DNA-binding domain-containing protein [Salinarchaeum chitinilyticum]